jgi:hypothetical protein
MKKRKILGLAFSVILLLLVTGSGLAGVPTQPREPVETSGAGASPGANTPWFVEEIDTDGDIGLYASVAYDPSLGVTYVSYYDATNQRLRLARSNGFGPEDCGPNDEWGCHTVDSGPDVGKYSSVAVNPKDGGVGIAYHDATNGKLKYLYFKNPHMLVHSIYTIDKGITGVSTTGLHTSLKYTEDGQPNIAYQFYHPAGVEALMWAYYSYASGNCVNGDVADEWRCETIITGEGVGEYSSLYLLDMFDVRIAYYDAGRGELWYADSSLLQNGNCGPYETDWACYPVTGGNDVGKHASLYVDSGGYYHIAYYDATTEKLMYARELAGGGGNCGVLGSAQCDEIDAMPGIYHSHGISIAEDPAGYPAIAYQDIYGSLKLARPLAALGMPAGSGNCGPEDLFLTWYCQTIDPYNRFLHYRNADYVSLTFRPDGLGIIAYNGFIKGGSGNLRVAYQRPFQNHLPLVARNP